MDLLDGDLILDRLRALAAYTDVPGELTRLSLSPAHKAAAAQLLAWFGAAGLAQVRIDGTGSVTGRYEASRPGAPALLLGSHIDTVRDAGLYDGNLGVLVALQAVAALQSEGRRLPFAVEIVAFSDEEGVRFPSTLSASRAYAGAFDPACLAERDAQGISRAEALAAFGAPPPNTIAALARHPADTLGYVEVHIEQGPVLEALGAPLGVVTAIAGASRGWVTLSGAAGHAGTAPMTMRRDALAGASACVLAVEAIGRRDVAPHHLVATIGVMEVPHAAVNVVAGAVRFSLDVRSSDDAVRIRAMAEIADEIRSIAITRGLKAEIAWTHEAPASPCDQHLQSELAAAISSLQLVPRFLPSGAGHDAMAFRGRLPMAMLFVRSRNGSHSPAEHAEAADIGHAARALHAFLLRFTPPLGAARGSGDDPYPG